MKTPSPLILSALTLAFGILAGSALSRLAPEASWWVMGGVLVVAASVVGARLIAGPARSRSNLAVALILGCVVLLTALVVALRDPARVPDIVPLLGVVGYAGLMKRRCCST